MTRTNGFFLLLLLMRPAWATVDYSLTVDTSSAASQMGYIEFQFNPGSGGSQLAYSDILNLMTDGSLSPPGTNTGDSSGQLPAGLMQDNQTSFNDYIEGITFGNTITFDLLLSGPAIDMPDGTGGGTFTLDFLNSDQSGYLFTDDPINDVPVFTVDINADGSLTAMTYASEGDGPPVVTFSGPAEVPEPSTLALAAAALGLALILRNSKTPGHARPRRPCSHPDRA